MQRIMTDDFINLFTYLNRIKAVDEKLLQRTGATYHQTKKNKNFFIILE